MKKSILELQTNKLLSKQENSVSESFLLITAQYDRDVAESQVELDL